MPLRLAAFASLAVLSASAFGQRDLYKEAVENYQRKQYDQALTLAEQALQANGNNPACLHLYGAILASVGRFASAEEYLRKAAAISPDQPLFTYELGALLHNERKYAEAVPVLTRAVELSPENLTARMML